MANHASMVDIWALFVAVPLPVRFIAKKQLGRIPLFGWAMRAGRFIFIDRQNPHRRPAQHRRGGAPDPGGPVGGHFPEGTRVARRPAGAVQEGRLSPGASSRAPTIVPVAHPRLARGDAPRAALIRRGRRSRVEIGAPISTAGLRPRSRRAAGRLLADAALSRTTIAQRDASAPSRATAAAVVSRSRAAGSGPGGGAVMPPAVRSPVSSMRATRRGRQPAAADVDQRADQDADHVLQERGGLDLEGDERRPGGRRPGGGRSRHGGAAVAVRGAEAAEVVLAAPAAPAARADRRPGPAAAGTCQAVRACRGERTKWFQTV